MRTTRQMILPAIAALAVAAGCGPGYRYGASAEIGPGIDLYGYYPDYWGDWHSNYSLWSPAVVYEYGGRYYPTRVRNSRPVSVYRYRNQYFVPPRDNDFRNKDRRFDYRHRPTDQDYQRARPRPEGRGPDSR